MKRRTKSCNIVKAAGLAAALAMVRPALAAPVTHPAEPELAPRSVFAIPTNPEEGRDPFYPNSSRPYENAPSAKKTSADVTSLILRGISGPPEHRLAIINNRTVAVGDEQDLATPQGRIHLKCVDITTNAVVIECNGQNHELKYSPNTP